MIFLSLRQTVVLRCKSQEACFSMYMEFKLLQLLSLIMIQGYLALLPKDMGKSRNFGLKCGNIQAMDLPRLEELLQK